MLINLKGDDRMDFSSGIFAFFIGDFRFPDLKIGAVKFYYDRISDDFIVKENLDLRYSKQIVIEDSDFIIFKEFIVIDDDGEEDLVVEKYDKLEIF